MKYLLKEIYVTEILTKYSSGKGIVVAVSQHKFFTV